MENRADRLQRFQKGPPVEIIDTLLNSMNMHFNAQIHSAAARDCWDLVLLGIHAVALTISEALFGIRGIDGYRSFLIQFVDTGAPDDFSAIAHEIHDWRNVIAHQWLSQRGHNIGFDTGLDIGWRRRDGVLHLNPRLYAERYFTAFAGGGAIWDWEDILTNEGKEAAKARMIEKFVAG